MAAKQMSGVLRTYIAAGKATPSPPLGPSLGQVKKFLFFHLQLVLFTRALEESLFCFDWLLIAWSEHRSILQRVQRTNKTHHNWSSDPHDHTLQGNFLFS